MNEISNDKKEIKGPGPELKSYLTVLALFLVYLLCATRYFPDRPLDTLLATVQHLLASVPFVLGLTLVLVSIFTKIMGERPSMFFLARLFLTIGICIEFFFGLYHYVSHG